jgi:hypothetical protein
MKFPLAGYQLAGEGGCIQLSKLLAVANLGCDRML